MKDVCGSSVGVFVCVDVELRSTATRVEIGSSKARSFSKTRPFNPPQKMRAVSCLPARF